MTLEAFLRFLADPDVDVRSYAIGKLMRQAKPDDVFQFVGPGEIRRLWQRINPYLGNTREFWTWLFETWELQGRVWK